MQKCRHEEVETASYMSQYYFTTYIETVISCKNCGEILEEKRSKYTDKNS